jgi:hypothetical protein
VVAKCIAADIARFFVEESCLCDMNNEYLQSWVDNDSQLAGSSPAQDDHAGSAFLVALLVGTCMIWNEIVELSNQFKHAVYCLSPILKHTIQDYFLFNIAYEISLNRTGDVQLKPTGTWFSFSGLPGFCCVSCENFQNGWPGAKYLYHLMERKEYCQSALHFCGFFAVSVRL